MKPRLVLSGVNLVEAGPLSIFHDALRELSRGFLDRYEVIALVHRRDLFTVPGIRYIEFPDVKSSWLRRLRFEYFTCRSLSRELHAHLWLSMHDITPRVTADIRAVYCHNPAPFYRLGFGTAMLDRSFALFCLLYRFLYSFCIQQNDFVIVQQQWMREEFRRRYPVREVIVAHPSLASLPIPPSSGSPATLHRAAERTIFFFPAYPRVFKNVELLLSAAALLEAQGFADFEVWLTIAGSENPYAVWLKQRFGMLATVRWLGLQTRERVDGLYVEADCLVFPSRLESWGMPMSEFKRTGKQILAADLPYAHETVGDYSRVSFFSPTDAASLAATMQSFAEGVVSNSPAQAVAVPQPFADGWGELFRILLDERDPHSVEAGGAR